MRRPARAALLVAPALLAALAGPVGASGDPYRAQQWGLDVISAEAAWATSTGTGALVAVVDTGVDAGHPDLDSKVVNNTGADFVEPNGTCTKAPGKNGARTCTQDGALDANGHGTHVAGIVAAETGNGTGVAGVAPGAKVLAVRVLDAEGSGTTDQIAAGIRYAADQGADVINLSLGFLSGLGEAVRITGGLAPVDAAIAHAHAKDAVVVVAAGNDSVPLCAEPSAAAGVVCVGSTDRRDLRSFFSNTDATMTKTYLVAPGGDGLTCSGDVLSTVWRGSRHSSCSPANGYDAYAGTSMATPHVAGVAALLASQGLGRSAIIRCLTTTADDLGVPGRDPVYGYGRVDAAAAASCR